MGNSYTSQSISGYNATPPADDGTEVAANQVSWAKHKTKLADPIKTLSEAVNTEVLAAFGKLALYAANAQSINYTVVAGDDRKIISCTNTITITLPVAGTAAAGFSVTILNAGTGVITVDGAAAETINGEATILLSSQYDAVILWTDGTEWFAVHDARRSYDFAINQAKGTDIASATTTDIGAATGNYVDVTGTTTITGLGTVQAGTQRTVQFDGVLILTHNATSLILPGGNNITTSAGDVAEFVSLGSGNWKCTNYQPATTSGAVVQRKFATETTSRIITATVTVDNTIPQNTEGTETLTLAITPTSASNILRVTTTYHFNHGSAGGFGIQALFRDSTADAVAVDFIVVGGIDRPSRSIILHEESAASTSATTFKIRLMTNTGSMYTNRRTGGDVFGGTIASSLMIEEVVP